jgi:hypothetical protein
MKKVIAIALLGLTMMSCDGKAGELKKGMLNDSNDLCKCGLEIIKGTNLAECGKTQEEIRGKYKDHNDLLIELDEKVKDCIKENTED